ncbi:MAG: 50S ribosomal protein L25 [Synergistales bacterium 53_16]|jgi:large subunit ribosomal protein L25|nr:MAG: 50S ribosomal protein L25 [Synergistales bacterium 53_16]KUL00946.1 MAG: 50S ribosomal protein L25 [Synergistales bacterium 54_9]HAG23088.1 50S ribosomal protein L25 [Synergistaceae bacterium]
MTSSSVKLDLKKREKTGKETNRKLRSQGLIPAVFYGPNMKSAIPVTIKAGDILHYANSAHWETVRIDAVLPDGTEEMCLMRDIQRDPLTDEVLHIDFLKLVSGHKVYVNVPIEVTGRDRCVGVKQGGVFEQVIHELEMLVLPREIPDAITVDVSGLGLDEAIHVKDLSLPASAVLEQDPESAVVMVTYAKTAVMPEEAAAEEEEMEVEVLSKGKAKEVEEKEE